MHVSARGFDVVLPDRYEALTAIRFMPAMVPVVVNPMLVVMIGPSFMPVRLLATGMTVTHAWRQSASKRERH
jgi:hypothetical protein